MKFTEVADYCRKLRTRKKDMKYRPCLVYLVEINGIFYAHPDPHGLSAGQTVWADSKLWFYNHGDATAYAKTRPDTEKVRVVKLNICAFEEEIKKAK